MIIILLELRISVEIAEGISKKTGKEQWIQTEDEGFSGGIWMLWDEDEIKLKLLYVHKIFIRIAVISSGGRS